MVRAGAITEGFLGAKGWCGRVGGMGRGGGGGRGWFLLLELVLGGFVLLLLLLLFQLGLGLGFELAAAELQQEFLGACGFKFELMVEGVDSLELLGDFMGVAQGGGEGGVYGLGECGLVECHWLGHRGEWML